MRRDEGKKGGREKGKKSDSSSESETDETGWSDCTETSLPSTSAHCTLQKHKKNKSPRHGNAHNRPRLPLALRARIHGTLSKSLCKHFPVPMRTVRHIWDRHGTFQNARRQETFRRNKGKRPSYFVNHRLLAKAIIRTVQRPNWVRPANKIFEMTAKQWGKKKKSKLAPQLELLWVGYLHLQTQ